MEDTEEKISSLDSQDEDNVSGGFYEQGFQRMYSRCDKCGEYDAYPVGGTQHLCEKCLKKFHELTKE